MISLPSVGQRRAGLPSGTSADSDDSSYVSPSRLNLWLKCPLAYKYRYVDGIRSPTSAALFLGQRVHAGLECYYRHRMLGITTSSEAAVAQMQRSWESEADAQGFKPESVNAEEQLRQQASQLVEYYIDSISDDEPRPLAVEAKIEVPLVDPANGENLGINLLGVCDLVLPSEDGPVVIDFKTASRSGKPLEISHEIQMTCYAYLIREVLGVDESAVQIRSLIKTKVPKIAVYQYVARQDYHFRRLFRVIREYLDYIDRGVYGYRPSWTCNMCDHRDRCSKWRG